MEAKKQASLHQHKVVQPLASTGIMGIQGIPNAEVIGSPQQLMEQPLQNNKLLLAHAAAKMLMA
jgi:hypothetical protein